ncbi:MAG: efflux RND transporter periplasmic adaptor subunit [Planctomycetales bacterium]
MFDRSPFRVCIPHAFALAVLWLSGCHPKSSPVAIEEAPYQTNEKGWLIVREDLMPHLKIGKVQVSPISAEVEGTGKFTFAPGASYAVRVPFEGFIESVDVEVGSRIEIDTPLARVHSSDLAKLRSELQRLQPTLQAEQARQERIEKLVKEGSITHRELNDVKARVASLDAEMVGIRTALKAGKVPVEGDDDFILKASHAGEVIVRNIEPGERVRVDDAEPALVIGDPNRLVVEAHLPERDVSLLKADQKCRFNVPALGGEALTGKISSVVSEIDPKSRSIRIICTLDKPDPRLRAEMVTRVRVTVNGSNYLTVPRSAVLLRRDDRVVFIKRGKRELERRPVVTRLSLADSIQVVSGLNSGDEVITDGAVLLDGELDSLL